MSGAAAAEQRPNVYKDGAENTTIWDSVSSGWNTACGVVPDNFTELAGKYAEDTGGLSLIEDDSGHKENAWTAFSFKVCKVVSVEAVDDYPFGERAKSAQDIANIFSVNVFFMPTATSEICGPLKLQYEVCAYFADPSGAVPNKRLYKTTESPLGATDPFVQEFSHLSGSPPTIEYNAVTSGYNDNGDSVGKARFVLQETEGCPVWSEAKQSRGISVIVVLLTIVITLLCLGGCYCHKQGQFSVQSPLAEEEHLEFSTRLSE